MTQFQRFERNGLTGRECEGKNLLVVGVGRIGSIVASIGNALGMTVHAVDIVQDKPNISYVSFAEGVPDADAIISCMNLTDTNVGYFNTQSLCSVKRGCVFVNIARGEESPVADLVQLLADGILGGVGLDVYDAEPEMANALRSPAGLSSPQAVHVKALLQHPNVICTPHNAFNSDEAVERKSRMSVDQIRHFLRHGSFLWQLP
jgi:D-lactate dehydrogenase